MVELKTPGEIEAMAAAGAVVGRAIEATRLAAKVGVRLVELDAVAREVLAEAGATSPFLGYQPSFAHSPYPGVVCLSVNDAVLSVDCGATLDGWTGDAAISFSVGRPNGNDAALIDCTEAALRAGIAAARAGAHIGDISAAIGSVARAARYGLHTDFGGHGIGRTMHESPHIPNDGRPGRGMRLQPGLTIAIEPWFLAGGQDAYRVDDDGWTLRSADGSRAPTSSTPSP